MTGTSLWLALAATTLVAAALYVLIASQHRAHALLFAFLSAALVDAVYLFGAFRLAPAPGPGAHYAEVGAVLFVATFPPGFIWVAGWRVSSRPWVRVIAAALAILFWAAAVWRLGLAVGCTLDANCS